MSIHHITRTKKCMPVETSFSHGAASKQSLCARMPGQSRCDPALIAVTVPEDRAKAKLVSICHHTNSFQSSA